MRLERKGVLFSASDLWDALCGLYEVTARYRRTELREGKLKDGLLWFICLQRVCYMFIPKRKTDGKVFKFTCDVII